MIKVRRIGLSKFDFPIELDQSIVDGIIRGYKDYLAVRADMQKRLAVSGAYAWTKGNHIDSFVNDECRKYDRIESTIKKAGYTWEYLQFTITESQEKYLLLIKNSGGLKRIFTGQAQTAKPDNYLANFAKINDQLVNDNQLHATDSNKFIQLELTMPELVAGEEADTLEVPTGYDRFYVVTYEFDDAKMISRIALTLPNQQEMKLVEVADLTPLIASSTVSINDEELEPVKNDKIPASVYGNDVATFGYGVATDQPTAKNQGTN